MKNIKSNLIDFMIGFLGVVICVSLGFYISNNSFKKQPSFNLKAMKQIPKGVGKKFAPYVSDFIVGASFLEKSKRQVELNLPNLVIKFGNAKKYDHDYAAVCEFGITTVTIEKSSWTNLTHYQKQNLIDHELGHCLLGRTHRHVVQQSKNGSMAKSIMFPSVLPSNQYEKNKNKLRYELFNPKYISNVFNRFSLEFNIKQDNPVIRKLSDRNHKKEFDKILDNYINGDDTIETTEQNIYAFTKRISKKDKVIVKKNGK